MNWLKKYWIEILIFAVIFAVYILCLSPNMTWMMVDSDGVEYVMDAKYFYPAHHTSAPLYLLTGHVFLQIPFGTEYWRMSLMSAVFTLGSMIFIYLIVRHYLRDNPKQRFYAILASAIFGSAALVIAQAIIVETYAIVTMFSVAAFYFVLKKRWYWASIMLGMGLVTHHLIFLTWVVLLIGNKEMRRWKPLLITFGFLLFYIYMPLSVMFTDQPNMWGNTGFADFFQNNVGVFTMLVGQIAIYDFPKRILDTFGILGISLGLALIPIVWYLIKKRTWKHQLLWLFGLPILYYMCDLAPQTAKYFEASIAWGAIMAVLGLAMLKINWRHVIIAVSVVPLLAYHAVYFDLGRTMDKDLAATKFYEEQLPRLNDGDIFVTMAAWEWIEVFYYNKENDRNIIPVCVGILASNEYQDMMRDRGVVIPLEMSEVQVGSSSSHELNKKQVDVAMSIIENNDNVWVSHSTEPEVYGAVLVPAEGNEHEISRWVGESEVIPQWRFKPSNPYDIITGAIEVEEWVFILQSNRSVLFFMEYATFGIFALWLIRYLWKVRKKNAVVQIQKEKEEDRA